MVFVFLGIGILISAIYILWTWNYQYWKRRGIPGPEPHILYGNTKSFLFSSANYALELEQIYRSYRNSGYPAVGYYAGRSPHLLVVDPIATKEIFIKNFAHFNNNEVSEMMSLRSDPLMARNPFFQKSDLWKTSRKELVPGFTNNRVKTFFPIIKEVCEKLLLRINTCLGNATGAEIDIDDLTGRFTTEVVSDVIFGINANALGFDGSMVLNMGKRFIAQFARVSSFFIWSGIIPKLKHLYKYKMVQKEEADFFTGVVKSAVEARQHGGSRDDFLQFLVQMKEKKGLDWVDMTAHAMTFYLDGYDTSAIAMAFTLYELALNPDVQDKLRAEIEQTVPAIGGELTFDNLMEMEYLDQVVNESLRLHPPIGLVVKQCTKKFRLEHPENPIEIPAGTPIMVHIASIHRDPQNYPDPMRFEPERFAPQNGGAKKFNEDGIFMAFGGGPRICLGMRFALTQVKAFVCEMVRNFRIETEKDLTMDTPKNAGHFFNYPSNKIQLRISRL